MLLNTFQGKGSQQRTIWSQLSAVPRVRLYSQTWGAAFPLRRSRVEGRHYTSDILKAPLMLLMCSQEPRGEGWFSGLSPSFLYRALKSVSKGPGRICVRKHRRWPGPGSPSTSLVPRPPWVQGPGLLTLLRCMEVADGGDKL